MRFFILTIGCCLWLTSGGLANDVRFSQVVGATNLLAITQANASSHSVHGLDDDGAPDTERAMQLKGNFSSVEIAQSSSAGTVVAGKVAATVGLSSIDYQLSGSGDHQVVLHADTDTLHSTVSATDHGVKTVDISAVGTGLMQHSITLQGGSANVSLIQTAQSSLFVTLNAIGDRAVAEFHMAGTDSSAIVDLNLGSDARFTLNQTGINSSYNVAASVGNSGSLTINQLDDNTSLADTGGLSVTVPDGASLTISR